MYSNIELRIATCNALLPLSAAAEPDTNEKLQPIGGFQGIAESLSAHVSSSRIQWGLGCTLLVLKQLE